MALEKLDPPLLSVLELLHAKAPTIEYGPHAMVMALGVGEDEGPMLVSVFLQCTPGFDVPSIEKVGAWVGRGEGRVLTATLPLSHLEALCDLEQIERITASRYLRPQLDQALAKTRVVGYRTRNALTGSGVVVGIVDSGLDTRHAAFAGRVHRIWDQTLAGPGIDEGAMGTELQGNDFGRSTDEHGHGTHVAGIAAGDHPTYGGVAPGATLVVVKTRRSSAQVLEAIRYIFRVARELQQPAVVNLSLGGHWDAHDGTDPLSIAIDDESGPGRIVCVAAGNDSNESIHARRTVRPGEMASIRFRVPPASVHLVTLNGWYSGEAALEIAIRSPSDFVSDWQPSISEGVALRTYLVPEGLIQIGTPGRSALNGDFNVEVLLKAERAGQGVAGGVWQLLARNSAGAPAVLDLWAIDGVGQHVAFSGESVDDGIVIGSPGTAARAITVGAYTTRVSWIDATGEQRTVGLTLDDVSDFSSRGPLRNGARKPDLVAPGAMIVSLRSSHAPSNPHMLVDAGLMVMQGTSMAAPFITGLVALMLQRDPTLSPEAVKADLVRRCQIRGNSPAAFDPQWGYGLIEF